MLSVSAELSRGYKSRLPLHRLFTSSVNIHKEASYAYVRFATSASASALPPSALPFHPSSLVFPSCPIRHPHHPHLPWFNQALATLPKERRLTRLDRVPRKEPRSEARLNFFLLTVLTRVAFSRTRPLHDSSSSSSRYCSSCSTTTISAAVRLPYIPKAETAFEPSDDSLESTQRAWSVTPPFSLCSLTHTHTHTHLSLSPSLFIPSSLFFLCSSLYCFVTRFFSPCVSLLGLERSLACSRRRAGLIRVPSGLVSAFLVPVSLL